MARWASVTFACICDTRLCLGLLRLIRPDRIRRLQSGGALHLSTLTICVRTILSTSCLLTRVTPCGVADNRTANRTRAVLALHLLAHAPIAVLPACFALSASLCVTEEGSLPSLLRGPFYSLFLRLRPLPAPGLTTCLLAHLCPLRAQDLTLMLASPCPWWTQDSTLTMRACAPCGPRT